MNGKPLTWRVPTAASRFDHHEMEPATTTAPRINGSTTAHHRHEIKTASPPILLNDRG